MEKQETKQKTTHKKHLRARKSTDNLIELIYQKIYNLNNLKQQENEAKKTQTRRKKGNNFSIMYFLKQIIKKMYFFC